MGKTLLLIVFVLCLSVSAFAQQAENPALSERIVKAFAQKLPGWTISQNPRIMHGGMVSDIQLHHQRRSTAPATQRFRCERAILRECESCTAFREHSGDTQANPGASTGDDRYLPL